MLTPTSLRIPLRRVEQCMGTVFSIDVRSPGIEPSVIDDAVAWLHLVDATFSTYLPHSQISRLGRGDLRLADCSDEVRHVLRCCEVLSRASRGYFSAWANGTLDPSGYVKGWAIQCVSELLSAHGSLNHCVNGGGDVQCAGAASPNEPWRIGIADPFAPGQLIGVVSGHNFGVATSGSAERGAHIFDPYTGRSPDALRSVTVIGSHLADADAHATAAYAMGERAAAWLDELPDHQAMIVYEDGSRWSCPTARA
jgi:thiamine biosynthesis lipoprotein